ncbi:hypothetical protein ACFX50_04535 [Neisseria meningitidis]
MGTVSGSNAWMLADIVRARKTVGRYSGLTKIRTRRRSRRQCK